MTRKRKMSLRDCASAQECAKHILCSRIKCGSNGKINEFLNKNKEAANTVCKKKDAAYCAF